MYISMDGGSRQQEWKLRTAYLACALLGGTAWFAIRRTIQQPGGYPIYGAAALRFTIAGVIYLLLWLVLLGRRTPTRRQIGYLVCAGLCSGIAHILIYDAAQVLQGGPGGALLALTPLIGGFLAWKTKTEAVSRQSLFGAAVAAMGVGVLSWSKATQSTGDIMSLLKVGAATFLFACSNLALKRQDAPVVAQGAIFLAASSLLLWFVHWHSGAELPGLPLPVGSTGWLAYTILAVSGVSFFLYLWLLTTIPMMKAMSIAFLAPLVSLGMDFVGEPHPLGISDLLGTCIIILGVSMEGFLKWSQPAAKRTGGRTVEGRASSRSNAVRSKTD